MLLFLLPHFPASHHLPSQKAHRLQSPEEKQPRVGCLFTSLYFFSQLIIWLLAYKIKQSTSRLFGQVAKKFIPCLVQFGREAAGEAGLAWGGAAADRLFQSHYRREHIRRHHPTLASPRYTAHSNITLCVSVNVNTAHLLKPYSMYVDPTHGMV